jgi:hypothetical protein
MIEGAFRKRTVPDAAKGIIQGIGGGKHHDTILIQRFDSVAFRRHISGPFLGFFLLVHYNTAHESSI